MFAFGQVLGRIHAIVVRVHMLAKMLDAGTLFILAMVRSHRPTELKRQNDHQENGNPTAHDVQYIGGNGR